MLLQKESEDTTTRCIEIKLCPRHMIWQRAKVGRKREAVSCLMGASDSRNRDISCFSGFGHGPTAQII